MVRGPRRRWLGKWRRWEVSFAELLQLMFGLAGKGSNAYSLYFCHIIFLSPISLTLYGAVKYTGALALARSLWKLSTGSRSKIFDIGIFDIALDQC